MYHMMKENRLNSPELSVNTLGPTGDDGVSIQGTLKDPAAGRITGAPSSYRWARWAGPDDGRVHEALNFRVYRLEEPPDEAKHEVPFGAPLDGVDVPLLCWWESGGNGGEPVGFATVRRQTPGTSWNSPLLVLDTIFVRRAHRGRGVAALLIQGLIRGGLAAASSDPERSGPPPHSSGEEMTMYSVSLSYPVSDRMLISMGRMLAQESNRDLREYLWLQAAEAHRGDDPDGLQPQTTVRQNLWWSLPLMSKLRGLDLSVLLSRRTEE